MEAIPSPETLFTQAIHIPGYMGEHDKTEVVDPNASYTFAVTLITPSGRLYQVFARESDQPFCRFYRYVAPCNVALRQQFGLPPFPLTEQMEAHLMALAFQGHPTIPAPRDTPLPNSVVFKTKKIWHQVPTPKEKFDDMKKTIVSTERVIPMAFYLSREMPDSIYDLERKPLRLDASKLSNPHISSWFGENDTKMAQYADELVKRVNKKLGRSPNHSAILHDFYNLPEYFFPDSLHDEILEALKEMTWEHPEIDVETHKWQLERISLEPMRGKKQDQEQKPKPKREQEDPREQSDGDWASREALSQAIESEPLPPAKRPRNGETAKGTADTNTISEPTTTQ